MEETRPLLGVQSNGVEFNSKNHNSSGSDENGMQVRLSYQDRKPFTRPSPLLRNNLRSSANMEQSATYNRYRYYSILHKEKSELVIPKHVLPPELFLVITKSSDGLGNQSSWVTIFSIWNTMMGTSLLSMPWAISQAGFTCGIFMMIFIAGLSFYTTRQIVHFAAKFSKNERETLEFSDICRTYLGRWGDWTAFVFSLAAIFGALIVYFVLMSNFLYNTGHFIHEKISPMDTTVGNSSAGEVLCPTNGSSQATTPHTGFYKYWDQQATVPFFLVIIVFPLMSIKSPTFFTRFNALGTLSVLYVIVFTIYKCAAWGINVDFSDIKSRHNVEQIKTSFPALSGTLTLAFFIHNCILSITRYQKHPKNNDRDVFAAYVLVAITYSLIGFLFYLTFPLTKSCIDQILLENFLPTDGMTFGVRFVLLFQMITVLPLLVYIIRIQIMNFAFGKPYPSFIHILVLNVFLMILCTVFARFYPHVGNIIRYIYDLPNCVENSKQISTSCTSGLRFTGAICGLAYVYTLPPIIHMLQRRNEGKLSRTSIVIHFCIIGIGILNFIGQIVISV